MVQIYTTDGQLYKTYIVVARGDVTGDGQFDDVDAGEMDKHGNYMYDWFWNSYGTYDQYKSLAGDVNGDSTVDNGDGELVNKAANYQTYYDMTYGGEIYF